MIEKEKFERSNPPGIRMFGVVAFILAHLPRPARRRGPSGCHIRIPVQLSERREANSDAGKRGGTVSEMSSTFFRRDGTVGKARCTLFGTNSTVAKVRGTLFGTNGTVAKVRSALFGRDGTVVKMSGTLFGREGTVVKMSGTHLGRDGTVFEIMSAVFGTGGTVLEMEGRALKSWVSCQEQVYSQLYYCKKLSNFLLLRCTEYRYANSFGEPHQWIIAFLKNLS